MAVATTTAIALGSLAVSAGASTYQAIQGNKQSKEAKQAMEEFEFSEINNAMANLAPSTAGAELRAEQVARQGATIAEQASTAGARGVVGMAPQIAEWETDAFREIGAQMDQMHKEYQAAVAQGEMDVQRMRLAQEQQELAGLGQLYNVGQQNLYSGLQGIAGAAGGAATMAAGGMFGGGKPGAVNSSRTPMADFEPLSPRTDINLNGDMNLPDSTTLRGNQPSQFLD